MHKILAVILLAISMLAGCHSSKQAIEQSQTFPESANWPEAYLPEKSKFFVHNHIEIQAPPEVVWNLLIHAESWPEWYKGAENVIVQHSEQGKLNEGAVFTWKTMGMDFESTIREFDPPYRLSWESEKKSIQGYHSWLIIPSESGCTLVTDESQKGWLTFMEKTFQPNKLRKLHDVWLEEIKMKAESNEAMVLDSEPTTKTKPQHPG